MAMQLRPRAAEGDKETDHAAIIAIVSVMRQTDVGLNIRNYDPIISSVEERVSKALMSRDAKRQIRTVIQAKSCFTLRSLLISSQDCSKTM
jgi:hypothetical protein